MRRIVGMLAVLAVAGGCSSAATPSQVSSSAAVVPSAAEPALDLDGTWVADLSAADVEDVLGGGEFDPWAEPLGSELAQPVTLTLEGEDYTVTVGKDEINGGVYEVDGATLKLAVEPNGLTLLEAELDGDDLTFAFTSNSTQEYPPSEAPEEAVQRALFTSAPFVRA